MILTVTLNPAVDISYKLESFSLDAVNRVRDVSKTAGGKGLNVTRVLQQLGEDVAATGFLGGSLGAFIRSDITGVRDYFVGIAGETRNCIAVIHEGKQTEILESGPVISADEADIFLKKFSDYLQSVDIVTISGSLPKGLADNFYGKIIEIASVHDVPVLLDTKGELLAATMDCKPFLIKPNLDELGDLLGEKVDDEADTMKAVMKFENIPWVVVTNGSKGAVVRHGKTIYRVTIPRVDAVNPVGSGDSVVAGFAAGLSRGLSDMELIKFALAMGVLNAMEEKTGQINPDNINWCVEQIGVEKI